MTILKMVLYASAVAAPITTAVVETVPRPSVWTEGTIAAFFAGLTLLLTQLLNIWMTHKAKTEVKSEVKEVYRIVDGGNTALMEEVVSLKEQRADGSNRISDRKSAEVARAAVIDKKALVVDAANEKKGDK